MTSNFPTGELSLVCGKTGSGKTLLLLCKWLSSTWPFGCCEERPIKNAIALLGEADLLSGQLSCPRSALNTTLISPETHIKPEDWIVQGACAYVPQVCSIFLCDQTHCVHCFVIRLLGCRMRQSKVGGIIIHHYESVLTYLDNILFSLPFQKDRYEQTLDVRVIFFGPIIFGHIDACAVLCSR